MRIKTGKKQGLWFQVVFTLLGSFVLLLIVAPLLNLMVTTSLSELTKAAVDKEVIDSIKLTLQAALAATMACTVAGIPLAYILARKKFPGRAVLMAIVDIPIIIPHSAAGIALFMVIGRGSLIGKLVPGETLVGTSTGIGLAMAFVSVPFLINAAQEAFEGVNEKLEKAARTLGASPWRVFFTVSLPLAWRGIVSGMTLMWARGISEFGAVVIIAYHPMTTPVMVFQRFNDYGYSYARSVAVLLILICVVLFVTLRIFSRVTTREGDHA